MSINVAKWLFTSVVKHYVHYIISEDSNSVDIELLTRTLCLFSC